jgi:hypothetical protein
MSNDTPFSSKVSALTDQIHSLLQGVGGTKAGAFLDALATLTTAEQDVVLELFTSVLLKVSSGEERLFTLEGEEKRQFAINLQEQIIDEFAKRRTPPALRVVRGYKSTVIEMPRNRQ